MSGAFSDEALLSSVSKAISGAPFPSKKSLTKANDVLMVILKAGYRVVKPDDDWGDFIANVPGSDELPGYRIAHADGDRAFAIETILEDSDETHDLFETFTVPVSRADLIAELVAMKEAAE